MARPRRGTAGRPLLLGILALAVLAGGAVLWSWALAEVVAPPAPPGHHDFLAFHSAARLIAEGRPSGLYSASAITALERTVLPVPVGAAGYMPYLSPPFAAAIQAPLGLLSEPVARQVWMGISLVIATASAWLATAGMAGWPRRLAWLCLMATFPFFQAFVEGQWSFVMLLGGLVGLRALGRGADLGGGMALAVLALKPPLLLPAVGVLVWQRRWRALLAMLGTALVMVVATLPWTGIGTQLSYLGYLAGVLGSHLGGAGAAGSATWEGALGLMEGINGLVAGYLGQSRVILVDLLSGAGIVAVLVVWCAAAAHAGRRAGGAAGAALLVAGVAAGLLSDVHLYPQDCVLALLALPALLRLAGRRRQLLVVLGMCVALDTVWLDQLTVTTHLFAWILVGALVWGVRAAKGAEVAPPRRLGRWATASSTGAR
ncbi:MAG: glycosyltransferase family 87 protein [Candidatus Dormibacteria bacterium]